LTAKPTITTPVKAPIAGIIIMDGPFPEIVVASVVSVCGLDSFCSSSIVSLGLSVPGIRLLSWMEGVSDCLFDGLLDGVDEDVTLGPDDDILGPDDDILGPDDDTIEGVSDDTLEGASESDVEGTLDSTTEGVLDLTVDGTLDFFGVGAGVL
jgi:hypothetical protein